MPITLVIADDHPLILDAMENLFRLEKDLKVVARCLNGDEALQAVRRHHPDKKLFISEGMVKIHLHNIYQKLGVDSRTMLARYAQENGLV